MNKIEKYKMLYPDPNGLDNILLKPDGKVEVPKWLVLYLVHRSGLKTKKKRKFKKRLKKELVKLIKLGMIQ